MEIQGKLLPFYLVVDVSGSMSGRKLDAANRIMLEVRNALAKAPILADKVRFGLIDFGSDAQVRLPLCDVLDDGVTVPTLAVRGATSYLAAFRLLRKQIEADVDHLKADGFAVHRPAVFFLSDGEPTDTESEWRAAFHDLTWYEKDTKQGFAKFPNVIPFGVDQANPQVLQSLIHPATGNKQMQMYLMDKGEDAAKAIMSVAEILISSVLASSHSVGVNGSGIMLPAKQDVPAGITAYSADDFL
jgi:uncharacterized protein YegL